MSQSRSFLLAATATTLALASSFTSVIAQRRGERLPPPRDPQFYEPRNKLEDFDSRMETLLVKGRHWIGTVRAQNGWARVEAYEIRDSQKSERATGVLISMPISNAANGVNEVRSFIDYEEIDLLLKALDAMAKADDSVTKLSHFEEHYRTRGDFEAMVFKELASNVVNAAIEGGFFDRVRLLLTLDDLTKLRWMISQAKDKLDEVR